MSEELLNHSLEPATVSWNTGGNEVDLYTLTLCQLLNEELRIPDYQRIYCWDEKTVRLLWEDIRGVETAKPYRLGTVILQRKDGGLDIIDGQQRLVTLALFLQALQIEGFSLLEQKYLSQSAMEYVGYNKYLIKGLLSKVPQKELNGLALRLQKGIEFNVLVLNESSLDLAYTFFSNENSRGKELSDFDLLKAHHLRFMADNEDQSMHIAKKWDQMILTGDREAAEGSADRSYVRSLAMYVFRLRKWIRMDQWEEGARYNVKNEYESGPMIAEIPPFGEKFDWNESIQGGSHFFAYTDSLLARYRSFKGTEAFQAIHRLKSETHWWYRDVIESLLFGYFLKFGDQYLAEALTLIAIRISQHRYENGRAHLGKLLAFAGDTRIIMMVDRATSPTFFLGELRKELSEMTLVRPSKGIRERYAALLADCLGSCKKDMLIDSIKNMI